MHAHDCQSLGAKAGVIDNYVGKMTREAATVPTAAIPTTAIPTNIDGPTAYVYGFQSSMFTLKSVSSPSGAANAFLAYFALRIRKRIWTHQF